MAEKIPGGMQPNPEDGAQLGGCLDAGGYLPEMPGNGENPTRRV